MVSRRSLLLLLVAVCWPWPAQAQADRIRVYLAPIEPPASGFIDEAHKRRTDSRADIVAQARKKKAILIVDQPAEADIHLTVVSSGRERRDGLGDSAQNATTRSVATDPEAIPTVRAMMRAGTYEGKVTGRWASWGGAAYDLAHQVETWAKDNRALLLQKRKK